MTTLADQHERIAFLLQKHYGTAQTFEHQASFAALARRRVFTQITWIQAIQGQALYTLPDNVVTVSHVLYDQRVLRYVTERSLDTAHGRGKLRSVDWSREQGEPTYWTLDGQSTNVVRIVPPPLRSGSSIPPLNPFPFMQDLDNNLLLFHTEDPSATVSDPADVLPTLLDHEDILVYHASRSLAMLETPDQDIPLSQALSEILGLYTPQRG